MKHTETEPLFPNTDPFFWYCVAVSIVSLIALAVAVVYFNANPI